MGLGVDALQGVGCYTGLNEAGELTLVGRLVILLQRAHVLGNVLSENVPTMNFGIELLGLTVVAGESLAAK